MKAKLLIAAVILLFTANMAPATIKAQELLRYCTEKNESKQNVKPNFCIGYIAGFLDTYVLTSALHGVTEKNRHFCLGSKGIPYGEAIRVAVDYMNAHPNLQNQSARRVLLMAFANRFPCNQMKQQQSKPNNDRYNDQLPDRRDT